MYVRKYTAEQRQRYAAAARAKQRAMKPEQKARAKVLKRLAWEKRRAANPEEYKRRQRKATKKYLENNIDKCRERCRRWVKNNKTKAAAGVQKWRTKNPKRFRELIKASEARHPERVKRQNATTNSRRQARLAGASGNHTPAEWLAVLDAHGHRCHWCGCKGTKLNPITKDHLVALSAGGTNCASNLVPACRKHNAKKHAKDPLVFARSLGLLL